MKVVVGPFVHAMPDAVNRHPGPGFDSKAEMVRWFNHWLGDASQDSDIISEPDLTLFIRSSLTTGTYRYEPRWPIPELQTRRMYISKGQKLTEKAPPSAAESETNRKVDILEYRPWIGFEGGLWLGGLTEDQRPFDEYCLVYQSDPIEETVEVVGFVNVSLQVRIHTRSTMSYISMETGEYYVPFGSLGDTTRRCGHGWQSIASDCRCAERSSLTNTTGLPGT